MNLIIQIVNEGMKLRDLKKLKDLGQSHFTCSNANNVKFWICSNLKKTFDSLASPNEEISLLDVRLRN